MASEHTISEQAFISRLTQYTLQYTPRFKAVRSGRSVPALQFLWEMWKDREDMQDSTKWVQELRKSH